VALTIAPWWREDGPIVGTQRFAIRYGIARPLLSILGMGPAFSGIDLGDDRMKVKMGWVFRVSVPRASVRGAEPSSGLVGGIGVHGWNGRWLVNGAATGLVTIDIDPKARAFVCGFPVRLRRLRVSVDNPEELAAALRT
jgi:hypothetical protein